LLFCATREVLYSAKAVSINNLNFIFLSCVLIVERQRTKV
jgi:hypothetical protein